MQAPDVSGSRVRRYTEAVRFHLPWLAALLVLVGFAALVLSRVNHFDWSDDEAVFVLTARAVQQGSRLYDEVWFNYLPGFLQLLNAAFAVGGFSLSTARIAVMCCALLALLLVTGLSRSATSPRSGVFTMLLLATSPHFLALSGSVMTEVPAIGLAVSAVWAALVYHRTRQRLWLALSSLALAASLSIKPTMIPTVVVLSLAVWLTEGTPQRRLASAVLLVTLTILLLAVGLLLSNPMGFLRQFVLTYVRSKAAFELDLPKNARSLVHYFLRDKYQLSHVSLLLLWGYGWYTLRRCRPTEAILLGIWFVAVIMMLLLHAPLYRHHLVQLLFPVAVLAGVGLDRIVATLRTYHQPIRSALRYILLVITMVELALSLRVDMVTLPRFEADNAEMGEEAARHIRETTHADEHVISDAHIIALRAGRPVPPELTNTSRMRIKTGQLTSQQAIDIARRVHPGAIVFWERKLDLLDDFATWVACQYDLTMHSGERHRIYQPRQPVTSDHIAVPLNAYFGQTILLLGYSVQPQPVQMGSPMEVTLYWKAISMPEGDFRAFVHLVDAQDTVVGQDDSPPRDGQCPTGVWQPDEIIVDLHAVDVDQVGVGGPYRLVVGLYDGEGHRLPPFDSQGNRLPHNRVVLSLHTAIGDPGPHAPTPQNDLEVNLGDYVELMGYDVASSSIQSRGTLSLTLYWRCLSRMTTSYTVFIHLLNERGQIVAQGDQLPGGGGFPTIGWLPGEVIADHYTIPLQKEALMGDYRIELGMYDVSTGQRLPVFDETGRRIEFDRVLLDTPIRVGQP
jgi:predicted small integral membrane protein